MHAEASKLHTYSVEALEAKKQQNHTSPHYSIIQPPAASMEADVNTKYFVKMAHYCKIFNWLLDCSLKQPPWSLGVMERRQEF